MNILSQMNHHFTYLSCNVDTALDIAKKTKSNKIQIVVFLILEVKNKCNVNMYIYKFINGKIYGINIIMRNFDFWDLIVIQWDD